MKKSSKKKIVGLFLLSSMLVTACTSNSSKSLEKFENKAFKSKESGQILIVNDKKEKTLSFRGPSVVKPVTDPKKTDKKSIEKEQGGIYKNPKIVVENGKTYLTADKFEYKLLIKDDSTIIDEEDNTEYKITEMK